MTYQGKKLDDCEKIVFHCDLNITNEKSFERKMLKKFGGEQISKENL